MAKTGPGAHLCARMLSAKPTRVRSRSLRANVCVSVPVALRGDLVMVTNPPYGCKYRLRFPSLPCLPSLPVVCGPSDTRSHAAFMGCNRHHRRHGQRGSYRVGCWCYRFRDVRWRWDRVRKHQQRDHESGQFLESHLSGDQRHDSHHRDSFSLLRRRRFDVG